MKIITMFQDSSSDFSQNIVLDGTTYNLRITWNTRDSNWYMDIKDSALDDILLGLRLAPRVLLLEHYSDSRLPTGDFYLLDTTYTPENQGVTFDNLGSRYVLYYVTEEEFEEAEESL